MNRSPPSLPGCPGKPVCSGSAGILDLSFLYLNGGTTKALRVCRIGRDVHVYRQQAAVRAADSTVVTTQDSQLLQAVTHAGTA